ncbi:MAG TPA: hypothetical protein VG010_08265 [Solirubrobacteraceae bacterium]|jgi:hypothetical protein|nr:hypothetical protein [Solirubrobacteraceae bacterium]
MSESTKNIPNVPSEREANVLLELRVENAMSEEVLDANSDALLEAVQSYGADIALGPTISLNLRELAIRLRFDVIAPTEAQVHRAIADVLQIIEEHTDIVVVRSRSETEIDDDALVAC